MALFFSRHTEVYLEQGSNVWKIPVLDGFSFSQSINTSEVTLNEMETTGGISRRGRTMFNDSLAPAEWSFSSYCRPFVSVGAATAAAAVTAKVWENTVETTHCIEEPLWANFIAPYGAATTWTPGADDTQSSWPQIKSLYDPVTYGDGATGTVFDFTASNSSTVGTFTLYFVLGGCSGGTEQVYKIENCVVNSVSVDFEIDGITTFNWSGMGGTISDEAAVVPTATITEAILSTDTFIRNRLTTLGIVAADTSTYPGSGSGAYSAPLTGGSISFENNISYLTPESLCVVNSPIGHVTGTRSIGGNFTAYLAAGVAGDVGDLFEDLAEATDVVTNSFALTFNVGGGTAPALQIVIPQCHLEIPTHSIEDVISVDVNFAALPSSMDATDECTVKYLGAAYTV